MALDVETLRSSFELVTERQPDMTRRFYEILFDRYPQARPLFHRNKPEVQQKMLGEALVAVLDHIEDAAWLQETLHGMGVKHIEYGVTDEMYDWVGECLIATMCEVAGNDWSKKIEGAWLEAYTAIASMMKAGAAAEA